MKRVILSCAALAAVIALALAGSAPAIPIGLPADGSQVNNDPAKGIDPNQNAGVSDVVGGSLIAGGGRVPWATFEQRAASSQHIFVRAFKAGQWVTQGASLNIDPNVEAEAPSIDFAGAGRTVPWDAWYEPSAPLGGRKQIFASRFVAAANTWQPEGQNRGSGIPSLNIHTDKEAENPSVAGGAAVAGADPVPWVAWQEEDGNVKGAGNHPQIFVSKGVKQASPGQPCSAFKPSCRCRSQSSAPVSRTPFSTRSKNSFGRTLAITASYCRAANRRIAAIAAGSASERTVVSLPSAIGGGTFPPSSAARSRPIPISIASRSTRQPRSAQRRSIERPNWKL